MLILAFDTATEVATSALVDDGDVVGERASVPRTVLEDVDSLLREAEVSTGDLDALVVGTGPGSFTSTRIGLAAARGLAFALDLPVAGVSTLEALAAAGDVYPLIDAGRKEVFIVGPRAVAPENLEVEPGTVCTGSGALRYREILESRGAVVPPEGEDVHVPWARLHVSLAPRFGPVEDVVPIYVRAPDVKMKR